MIKVLLVDDHQIILDGLSLLIEAEPNMEKVNEVTTCKQALSVLEIYEVDVAVVDIELKDEMDGIALTGIIKEKYPEVQILILTMHDELTHIKECIRAGASGYILKNRGREEFVKAVSAVYRKEDYLGDKIATALMMELKEPKSKKKDQIHLTKREKEILCMIVQGMTAPLISEKLFIAVSTVETHRKNLKSKTESPNTKNLITWAITNGYCQ